MEELQGWINIFKENTLECIESVDKNSGPVFNASYDSD